MQEKAAWYLEANQAFWEAAEQDQANGCTDPPEILRLHARDAQAKSAYWFEKAGNSWMHADVLLQGAIHLKRLGRLCCGLLSWLCLRLMCSTFSDRRWK